jgi:hypothetical protein
MQVAFERDEKSLYYLAQGSFYSDDIKQTEIRQFQFESGLIQPVRGTEATARAKQLFDQSQDKQDFVFVKRIDDRRKLEVRRYRDNELLRTMAPTDELWYQELTVINNRLLVTHSSHGIEFIDLRLGVRLFFIKVHERRPETLTFYTSGGAYSIETVASQGDPIPPELPTATGMTWHQETDEVRAAWRKVVRITREGWIP